MLHLNVVFGALIVTLLLLFLGFIVWRMERASQVWREGAQRLGFTLRDGDLFADGVFATGTFDDIHVECRHVSGRGQSVFLEFTARVADSPGLDLRVSPIRPTQRSSGPRTFDNTFTVKSSIPASRLTILLPIHVRDHLLRGTATGGPSKSIDGPYLTLTTGTPRSLQLLTQLFEDLLSTARAYQTAHAHYQHAVNANTATLPRAPSPSSTTSW